MAGIPSLLRRLVRYGAVAGAVLVAAGVVWTLGPGAGWVLRHVDGVHGLKGKELADALDAVRGRALAVGTGLAALVAVYYTARNADTARRTFQLGEQGQVTERYTKAIEQLGSDKLDIRLGGIYALERIAADSARDHPTVMEVLTAFIREHTRPDNSPAPLPTPDDGGTPPSTPAGTVLPRQPAADVHAALTVINRRVDSQDVRYLDLMGADLSGALLIKMALPGANLRAVNLTGASLRRANLMLASLSDANLTEVNLAEANLSEARLIGANLMRANLSEAYLFDAHLIGADLSRADLTGADLVSANLTDANLTGAIGVTA